MDPEDEEAKYFVRNRGRITGPFSIEQLQKLNSRGRFSRFHEVSLDRAKWMRASSIDELFVQRNSKSDFDDYVAEDAELTQDSAHDSGAPPPLNNAQSNWYYTVENDRQGPVSTMEMRQLIATGQLMPMDQVWSEGMPDWDFIENVPTLYQSSERNLSRTSSQQPNASATQSTTSSSYAPKSRVTYILLGLFLGNLGIHNFHAGFAARGIAQLLLTLCIIPIPFVALWAVVEVCTVTQDANGVRFT